ncbi:MAG: hypothetical protein V1934_04095 [Methanobacteriota archaeon]
MLGKKGVDAYLNKVGRGLAGMPKKERGQALDELREHILERAKELGGGAVDYVAIDKAIEEMGEPEDVAAGYVPDDPRRNAREAYWARLLQAALACIPIAVFSILVQQDDLFWQYPIATILPGLLLLFGLPASIIALCVVEAAKPETIPMLKDASLVLIGILSFTLFGTVPVAFSTFVGRETHWVSDFEILANMLLFCWIMVFFIGGNLLSWWRLSMLHSFPLGTPKTLQGYMRKLKSGLSPLDHVSRHAVLEEVRQHAVAKYGEYGDAPDAEKAKRFASEFGAPGDVAARYLGPEKWTMAPSKRGALAALALVGAAALVVGTYKAIAIWGRLYGYTVSPFGVLSSTFLLALGGILIHLCGTQLSRPMKLRELWAMTFAVGFATAVILASSVTVTADPYSSSPLYEKIQLNHPLVAGAVRGGDGNIAVFWVDGDIDEDSYTGEMKRSDFWMGKYDDDGTKLLEKLVWRGGANIQPISVQYAADSFFFFFSTASNPDSLSVLRFDGDGRILRSGDLSLGTDMVNLMTTAHANGVGEFKYRILVDGDSLYIVGICRFYLENETYEYRLEDWPLVYDDATLGSGGEMRLAAAPRASTAVFRGREVRETGPTTYGILESAGVDVFPGPDGDSVIWAQSDGNGDVLSCELNYFFVEPGGRVTSNLRLWNASGDNNSYQEVYGLEYGSFSHNGNPRAWLSWYSHSGGSVDETSATHFAVINPIENESVVSILSSWSESASPYKIGYTSMDVSVTAVVGEKIYVAYPFSVNDVIPMPFPEDLEYSDWKFNASDSGICLATFTADGSMLSKEMINELDGDIDSWYPILAIVDSSNEDSFRVCWMDIRGKFVSIGEEGQNWDPEYGAFMLEIDGNDVQVDEFRSGVDGELMQIGYPYMLSPVIVALDSPGEYIIVNTIYRSAAGALEPTQVEEMRLARFSTIDGVRVDYMKPIGPIYRSPNDGWKILAGFVVPLTAVCLSHIYVNWRRAAAAIKNIEGPPRSPIF